MKESTRQVVVQQDFYWNLGSCLHVFLRHLFLACLTESCSFEYKRFLNHTRFVTDYIQVVQGMWFHVYGWLLKVQGIDQG